MAPNNKEMTSCGHRLTGGCTVTASDWCESHSLFSVKLVFFLHNFVFKLNFSYSYIVVEISAAVPENRFSIVPGWATHRTSLVNKAPSYT